MSKFVTGLPSYRLVIGELTSSSWNFMNAENKENTALFDRHVIIRSDRFERTVETVI